MSTSVDRAMTFVPWLRLLAQRGGKGVVSLNNVDARALGRLADAIERECSPKPEEEPREYDL
jgi:hypothetical protein